MKVKGELRAAEALNLSHVARVQELEALSMASWEKHVCATCFPIVRGCLLNVSVDEPEQVRADQCIIVFTSKQHVLSNILVPIFQVQLHSAREALAEAAVGKNLLVWEKLISN